VRPEGIHLTLRFLGETTPGTLDAVVPALEQAAGACPPLLAELDRLFLLPNPRRPRVLALGIGLPEAGFTLQRSCEDAARRAGLEPEGRPFRPHLTLARFRDRARAFPLPDSAFGTARFSELVLFESHLGRGGSVYAPLRTFPLLGP
jgi:2'-5' RNA ligase